MIADWPFVDHSALTPRIDTMRATEISHAPSSESLLGESPVGPQISVRQIRGESDLRVHSIGANLPPMESLENQSPTVTTGYV